MQLLARALMGRPDHPLWYQRGAGHIWLPYAQMKTVTPPLPVVRTQGSRLFLADGRVLIDGIANWWTACHGLNHPHIQKAVHEQLDILPHVMMGGLAHEQSYRLASRLSALLPHDLNHVFFSDSGSVAVEVALKMAIQSRLNKGRNGHKILSFRGGYHGDTFATMAVCDPEEGMHHLFANVLPRQMIADLPTSPAKTDELRQLIECHRDELAAILVEPLVQGAGGMIMHDADVLKTLRGLADDYDLTLIFDEIFTGFHRTGPLFACLEANVCPDIITLSKALTGGVLPLAATIARTHIFDAFYDDHPDHALMHGPTFMGNALACAAANASLDLCEREPREQDARRIEAQMRTELARCRTLPHVRDVRVRGAIGVVQVDDKVDLKAVHAQLLARNVWIRPFRTIIYLTPALTISAEELSQLTHAIEAVMRII
jgi:adenosylmethionine---8-amino-7-oxononanoate aminotransferase